MTTCPHEDVTLMCPFGCGETVDSDTRMCSVCHEGVDPVRVCVYCDEELGTLGEHEQAQYECSRTIPPHFPSMVLKENDREQCIECGGVR